MTADRDPAYEILRSVRRILRHVSEHSRRLLRDAGLTVPQLLCLRAVTEEAPDGEVTVAFIARTVQLSAATVSRILDRLEQAGFVVRERRSADRRKVCLSLTDAGRERLASVPTPLHEQFLARLTALPAAERRELLHALERIVEMMEAGDVDAAPLLTSELDVRKPPPAG